MGVRPCDSRPRRERESTRVALTQLATAVQGTCVSSAVWDRARRLQQPPTADVRRWRRPALP
jgi:hypothetical protein